MRTWIKFYTKTNHDPDVGSLTWEQRGIWAALVALCGEMDCRNGDGSETGALDTMERTAWRIRCDMETFTEAINAFRERFWIDEREGVLYLVSYPRLQAKPPSAQREAVKQRVAAYRERNVVTSALPPHVTPSEAETETETESDTETEEIQSQNRDRNASPSQTDAPARVLAVSSSPSGPDPPEFQGRLKRCVEMREEYEGAPLSRRELTQMSDWFREHGTQAVWEATTRGIVAKAANLGGWMRAKLERQSKDPPSTARGP